MLFRSRCDAEKWGRANAAARATPSATGAGMTRASVEAARYAGVTSRRLARNATRLLASAKRSNTATTCGALPIVAGPEPDKSHLLRGALPIVAGPKPTSGAVHLPERCFTRSRQASIDAPTRRPRSSFHVFHGVAAV